MRKVQRHRIRSLPLHTHASPVVSIPQQSGIFGTACEHTMTHCGCMESRVHPEFILGGVYLPCTFGKYFVLVRGLSSHPLDSVFHRADVAHFSEVPLIRDLSWTAPLVPCLKSRHHTQGRLDVLLGHLGGVFSFAFSCRSVTHFEIIFMKGVRSAQD